MEGGAEELDPAGAMASMESRMEARKSGLARRGSGGDDGRRGYRYPSGRYRHWPGTAASVGNVVAALGCFPSALRSLRSVGFVGEGFGSGQLGRPCPGPPPILYSAGDGGPPAIMTGRPRSGRDQRGFGPIFGSGLEIISNSSRSGRWVVLGWVGADATRSRLAVPLCFLPLSPLGTREREWFRNSGSQC